MAKGFDQNSDNPERSEVTASGLGRTHRARWMGDRHGCRLVP
jgi:hypothetical protein